VIQYNHQIVINTSSFD